MHTNLPPIESLLELVRNAGDAIMEVYHQDEWDTQLKADQSPVTAADLAAERILAQGLSVLTPDIPILSEEAQIPDWSERQGWTRYWLIDPLDGTREFLQRNGEFTVNLALIDQQTPILGIVYAPAKSAFYWGGTQLGAWCLENGLPSPIQTRAIEHTVHLLTSRRHGRKEAEAVAQVLKDFDVNTSAMGSSLKLCLIASGMADLYPRMTPTSEWDTAAAQAILVEAGGVLLNANTLEPLRYNTKDSLENPAFIALGDTSLNLEKRLNSESFNH
ncbi:3'(2'),5'-bisphosphate nucleotidase CysQ [Nitrincola alkalisediminis]|uniref:3'(2'),5'-bisphosphate nucleotidase CysQ n=1 Tax=Nitrincola alkalisediminis TaxID=1366656 RepID=UPI001875C9B2|nr:3'(2'),5'-bisphosphate nucleotidase CysQ [Nitrincola alkalisediminis]